MSHGFHPPESVLKCYVLLFVPINKMMKKYFVSQLCIFQNIWFVSIDI